jgi:hypothetical protein
VIEIAVAVVSITPVAVAAMVAAVPTAMVAPAVQEFASKPSGD